MKSYSRVDSGASASFRRVSRSVELDQLDFGAGELAIGGHAGRSRRALTRTRTPGTSARRAARGRPVRARLRLSTPLPMVALPCGSRSTSSTRRSMRREAGGQVDAGGGLADAALLVRDREHARHLQRPSPHESRDGAAASSRGTCERGTPRPRASVRQRAISSSGMHALHRDQLPAAARRWCALTVDESRRDRRKRAR